MRRRARTGCAGPARAHGGGARAGDAGACGRRRTRACRRSLCKFYVSAHPVLARRRTGRRAFDRGASRLTRSGALERRRRRRGGSTRTTCGEAATLLQTCRRAISARRNARIRGVTLRRRSASITRPSTACVRPRTSGRGCRALSDRLCASRHASNACATAMPFQSSREQSVNRELAPRPLNDVSPGDREWHIHGGRAVDDCRAGERRRRHAEPPERVNAWTPPMASEIADAIRRRRAATELRTTRRDPRAGRSATRTRSRATSRPTSGRRRRRS